MIRPVNNFRGLSKQKFSTVRRYIFLGNFFGVSVSETTDLSGPIPPTPSERAPPIHRDMGVYGFRYRYPKKKFRALRKIYYVCDMGLKRFGVSLEDELLEQLDSLVKEDGFANRSQAIRFLVEKNLAEKKWQCNHIVAGTIFIIYDQQRSDICARISEIQIAHQDLILSSSQHYINEGTSLHVCTVMGQARQLTALADEMTSIKGIRHGKLLMSRAE